MPAATKNIVWIASYPKSGNTWVRFMACNLLFGRQDSAATVSALAPDIHEMGPDLLAASNGVLVKTHFAYSANLPLLARTAGGIYVVRKPADVLVSNFFYRQRRAGMATDSQADFDRYFEEFVANRGDPQWIRLGMGTWEENVRSWLRGHHPFPVVAIRYEDLSANPHGVCRMLAELLRPTGNGDDIRQAVENSSFKRMREIEEADIVGRRVGIFYKPYLHESIGSGRRFMREGSVGGGERRLTPAQLARLTVTFAPLLAELGYTVD